MSIFISLLCICHHSRWFKGMMPTLRSRRSIRRPTQYFAEDKFRSTWSIADKKKLLIGLKRSSVDCIVYTYETLQNCFLF